MPYRLRMSAEIGDWLAELCSAAPGSPESLTATEVGAALAAALSAADVHDLPLISDLAVQTRDPVDDSDLRAGVDYMYQQLLEALRRLRVEVDGAAAFRTTTRTRITPAGSEPKPFTPAQIAAAEKRERAATKRAQRWQAAVDRFRTMTEVAKARITAAEGARKVHTALLASASAGGEPAEMDQARADLATAESSLLAAKAQAVATLAEARRLLLAIRRDAPAAKENASGSTDDNGEAVDDTADGVAAGLLELRADPLGADIRILCAVEPPGTLTLLAVLEGPDAIAAHRDRAIGLADQVLTEIRADNSARRDPDGAAVAETDSAEAGELTFADTAPFLARYFPDSDGEVMRRAGLLAAATTLRALRRQHGLSLDDLATRTGLQAQELWDMETGGLRSAPLSKVAAYARALGATLTVATDDGTAVIG